MLQLFGLTAVLFTFAAYWLEGWSRWWVAMFSIGSAASAVYALLVEAYPFFIVELLWVAVSARRFVVRSRDELLR